MLSPIEIIKQLMEKDSFSKWLAIEVEDIQKGSCTLSMKVKKDMLNGFEIAHGGICYSLADSALAFAANSYGKKAVSIETSISHTHKVLCEDRLTATTEELNKTTKIGLYSIEITNQESVTVAQFKGTVLFSDKNWN